LTVQPSQCKWLIKYPAVTGHWSRKPREAMYRVTGHWSRKPREAMYRVTGHWSRKPCEAMYRVTGHWSRKPCEAMYRGNDAIVVKQRYVMRRSNKETRIQY
jgi:hypothetical protein